MSNYFVADQKIPITQKSVGVPSTNGLSYNSGQLIEIHVDPQVVKFFNPQESYLQFNCKLQMPSDTLGNVTRLQLDSHIGAQVLIRDIRIHDGNNNALLEEIVGYNVACGVKYDYHTNDSLKNKRALVEGAGIHTPNDTGTMGSTINHQSNNVNQWTDPFSSTTAALQNASYVDAKVCLPLNTGIFSNDKVFPCMLTNGLRISILLEDDAKCIRQQDNVGLNRHLRLNPTFHSTNGCLTNGSITAATNASYIYFNPDNRVITDAGQVPFSVGERLAFWDTENNVDVPITAGNCIVTEVNYTAGGTQLAWVNTSNFQVGAPGVNTNSNASHSVYSTSVQEQATFNPTYNISNVELVLQTLDMGNQYEADMMRRMKEGGTINYDFLSMTNYRYSQLASDLVANIQLPIENRRMKSIICVPTDASVYSGKEVVNASNTYLEELFHTKGVNVDQFDSNQDRSGLVGISDYISSYQFLYAGRLQPSRLVNCSKTSSKSSVSQQQLIELEKSLSGANISGQSMLQFDKNFVIGRSLALQNGVYDGRNKQFSLQVNYQGQSPQKNKLWNCFAHHVRRLIINGDSISVEV